MTELHQERRGRVLVLTLDGPATRNALSPDVFARGTEAFSAAAEDPATGAVVLTGANGAFCSGGDLNRLAAHRDDVQAAVSLEKFHDMVRAMRACPKPIVAAVEGVAAGAGFSIALASDVIVAARDARFVLAYVKVGLSPDGGATAFLAMSVPRHLAAEIALEGDVVSVERLHQVGVVSETTEPGRALERAMACAERLAAGAGQAQASIKRLLAAAYEADLAAQLDRERAAFLANLRASEAGEGIRAFLEKRPPRFGG